MSGECELCGESGFDCICDKIEKHSIMTEKRREIIKKKLAEMFKTGNPGPVDSEIEQEDQDPTS